VAKRHVKKDETKSNRWQTLATNMRKGSISPSFSTVIKKMYFFSSGLALAYTLQAFLTVSLKKDQNPTSDPTQGTKQTLDTSKY
jgi:hypothetical protein